MSNKKHLKKIYYHALEAVKAEAMISTNIAIDEKSLTICNVSYPLEKINNLYLFSVGKAGLGMAKATEKVLGNAIKGGIAISHQEGECEFIDHHTSTHPLVSSKSLLGAEKLIESVGSMKEDDFFIFCLSGGASAMIEKPIDGLHLDSLQKISASLLGSGIDITTLNIVRKAISQIKGGKLANMSKADGVVLVLSDVIGDDLNTIGSAPMMNGETLHHIIGNNEIALKHAKQYISKDIDTVKIVTTTLNRSSKKASSYIAKQIQKYDKKYEHFCLLFGGETTTKVKGDGQGGRNQELALRLLLKKCVDDNISILSAGSDGIDGNSPSTGAYLDAKIYKKIKKAKLNPKEYLKKSDSYHFFEQLGYDFTIGPTGTNVMDFIIVLKK
ncbi:MAG: D-glycerate 2-kinase (EC [uncultured Sulfurovum sp.]|uniref:D-glycerate 2-kinase (EC) n=1 Tax=uncultured Sulfurovum sp. TaxID=269237 RepID=A0A6S6U3S6_9BACT|nr:MAG: D-glycerate 2-kinase (EC [uncultured Sulfurovum sp.]